MERYEVSPAEAYYNIFFSPVQSNPTVIPVNPFDPNGDAQALRKAMKGFGTDEKAIISVLTRRSNAQRQQITLAYKTLFGKDLIKDLKGELGGNFENVVVAMMMPHFDYLASEVHYAINQVGTDESDLVEILCTANNYEIREISAAYYRLYGKKMEEELRSDTSGTFKRLLTSICTANRDESYAADPVRVEQDAQAMLRAGELRFGTDESTFNAILAQRSYVHLQQVFQTYQRLSGHNFEQAVDKEFSGDIKQGLLAIVKTINNKPGFFAERLHKSMAGLGTHDRDLIRIIVTRSEIDLATIKTEFQRLYQKSLESWISSDVKGDYGNCLLGMTA